MTDQDKQHVTALDFVAAARQIEQAKRCLIVSHENPDPDAYGSSNAVRFILQSMGKAADCINISGINEGLSFMPGVKEVTAELPQTNYDLLIFCDCATSGRTGYNLKELLALAPLTLSIDHHISNDLFADVNLLDTTACSTAEIVYGLMQALEVKLTPDIRDLLLIGIYSDSGSLQYSSVSPQTFRAVADLVEAGGEVSKLTNALYKNKPLNLFKLEAKIIENLVMEHDGQYAYSYVTEQMLTDLNLPEEALNALKGKLRSIDGVRIAALIRAKGDLQKVSLRSDRPYDVNLVAQKFSGGGHQQAAGIKTELAKSELLAQLSAAVKEELERH